MKRSLRKPFRVGYLIVSRVVLYIISGIAWLWPRSRQVVVFDSWRGDRFADNAKYFFLHLYNKHTALKLIWITRSKTVYNELQALGVTVYMYGSVLAIFSTLRAGVHVTDSDFYSLPIWLQGRAIRLNLWHGVPLKKIVYDAIATKKQVKRWHARGVEKVLRHIIFPTQYDYGQYIVAPSEFYRDKYMSAFKKSSADIIVAGQPRNEVLMRSVPHALLGVDTSVHDQMQQQRRDGQYVVLYMPTFREGSRNPLEDAQVLHKSFDNFLHERGIHLYIKFHHEPSHEKSFSNIHFVDTHSDPYPLLPHTNVLVTDYSSIYFDYLFLDRPIVFYAFDYHDYIKNKRELYFNYEDFTPGFRAYTIKELQAALHEIVDNTDDRHQAARQELRDCIYDTSPEIVSADIMTAIYK